MDIREGRAQVGALELAYEDWGNPADPALLLIMGFGAQLLLWPEGFCEALVRRGLRVIRFDNRDVGQSSRLSWPGGRPPSLWPVLGRAQLGKPSAVPYRLEAMAGPEREGGFRQAAVQPRSMVTKALQHGLPRRAGRDRQRANVRARQIEQRVAHPVNSQRTPRPAGRRGPARRGYSRARLASRRPDAGMAAVITGLTSSLTGVLFL